MTNYIIIFKETTMWYLLVINNMHCDYLNILSNNFLSDEQN
jgi:hypothetical protein